MHQLLHRSRYPCLTPTSKVSRLSQARQPVSECALSSCDLHSCNTAMLPPRSGPGACQSESNCAARMVAFGLLHTSLSPVCRRSGRCVANWSGAPIQRPHVARGRRQRRGHTARCQQEDAFSAGDGTIAVQKVKCAGDDHAEAPVYALYKDLCVRMCREIKHIHYIQVLEELLGQRDLPRQLTEATMQVKSWCPAKHAYI